MRAVDFFALLAAIYLAPHASRRTGVLMGAICTVGCVAAYFVKA